MGHSKWNRNATLTVLTLIVCSMTVFTFSCMSGGGGGDASDTGSVSFGLAMQNTGAGGSRSLFGRAVEDDVVRFQCETADYEISTIDAEIRDENGEVVAEGGPFSCAAGEGLIEDITPGDNYTVFVFARDASGEILFTGNSEPISVVAGEFTDAGVIVLESINARLDGDFIGTGFGFDSDDFSEDIPFWSVIFEANFDGFGAGDFNNLDTSDNSSEGGPLTYDIDFDGSLSATLSDGTVFNGILNPDNNILAAADTDFADDFFIEMDVVIKKSTGLTNAVLNGDYIGVTISSNPATALTAFTFFGDGVGEYRILESSSENFASNNLSYDINSEGGIAIDNSRLFDSDGVVSGDGSVLSLVDTGFRGNEDIDMSVLIKASSGLSTATLDGDYVAVSFGIFGGDSFGAQTRVRSIRADGFGNMEIEFNGSSDALETTYSVDSNGRITINLPGGEVYDGVVSSNGDIFNFVNTDSGDNFIDIGVAIRKTQ